MRDENTTFGQFFGLLFDTVGNARDAPTSDQKHPRLPDAAIYTGRGNYARYEPDMCVAHYRHDVAAAVRALVERYR